MQKKEFPEEEELVVATVDRIIGTSVFAKLEDYNNKEGAITFSEVAPGRIRNIRDYIMPNKKIICRVLRVDASKNHIDLSLRRVSAKEQKEMLEVYNREKSNIAALKTIVKEERLLNEIKEKFSTITAFFQEFIKNNEVANFLKKEDIEKLIKLVKEREKKVRVSLNLRLHTEVPNGIEIIKQILIKNKSNCRINYISAPDYSITLEGNNYKEANRKIREIAEKIITEMKSNGISAEIIETKK